MKIVIENLMNESGVKFGTSGVRGLGLAITDLVAYSYTTAFLKYLESVGGVDKGVDRVAVSGDLRDSTDRIIKAVSRAIVDFGCGFEYLGKVPTPAVVFWGIKNKIPSIMVTGSHVSAERNGIKFHKKSGEILKNDEVMIRQVEVEIDENLFDESGFLKNDFSVDFKINEEASDLYIKRYVEFFPANILSGRKIIFYQHSAVGRDLIANILEMLGAEVLRLGRVENFLAVDTESLSGQIVKNIADIMRENEADALVSTDGDSDRPLVICENGELIKGDVLGIITAKMFEADFVVTPVSGTSALEKSGFFKNIERTKIGSPFVIDALQKASEKGFKTVLGYETNGGFLINSNIEKDGKILEALPTRDSLIPILGVLLSAFTANIKLSELIETLPRVFTDSCCVKEFDSEKSISKINELFNSSDKEKDKSNVDKYLGVYCGEMERIDYTDGARIFFINGEIIHFRPSGNAPELRCYVEAGSKERVSFLVKKAVEIIESWR